MKSKQHAYFSTEDSEGFTSDELGVMSRQVPKGTKVTFKNVGGGWEAVATWDALDTAPSPLYTHYPTGVRSVGKPDMRETGGSNPSQMNGEYFGAGGMGSQER